MAGLIVPEYVWLTTGVGKWTNEDTARELAKRDAGISHLDITEATGITNTQFDLVDKDKFFRNLNGANKVYMIGEVQVVPAGESIYGDISALSHDGWGALSFFISYIPRYTSLPMSKRELVSEYEHVRLGESPDPTTLSVDTEMSPRIAGSLKNGHNTSYRGLVLVAMIVGSPQTDAN